MGILLSSHKVVGIGTTLYYVLPSSPPPVSAPSLSLQSKKKDNPLWQTDEHESEKSNLKFSTCLTYLVMWKQQDPWLIPLQKETPHGIMASKVRGRFVKE